MKKSKKLTNYIAEFESYIPQFETSNTKVSKSNIGWQIDHSLKVINGIIGVLKGSKGEEKSKLTLLGQFCLTTGYIPRGRGKAPKQVLPPEEIKKEDLSQQIEVAKQLVNQLDAIDKRATFKHPYFGGLNNKQTKRFIEIHTKHHLKIIRDILNVRQN